MKKIIFWLLLSAVAVIAKAQTTGNPGTAGHPDSKAPVLPKTPVIPPTPDSLKFFLQPVEVRALRAGEKAPFTKTDLSKQEIAKTNLGQDLPLSPGPDPIRRHQFGCW